eukprot:TRINITY_DN6794_c0_g1_i1.p1 TRINITY_DN6794_c0_g1~~TRINITY_DN6794_c0_g1_i1.p1  ORF type:complete len:499 (+),score=71.37 TRINITY_DN6794_c0_g1_i1:101-1597(+)
MSGSAGDGRAKDEVQGKATPLPARKVAVICIVIFTEGFSMTMIFPFLAIMVESFEVADNKTEIGYYAGLIASSFSVAQFFSSFFWGYLSDRWGRRPVLLVGLAGTGITILLFGVSDNLWMAILSRALNGLLNGNIGVAKSYLGEVTDKTNAARGFSVIGLTYGIAMAFGPTLGGFTSEPHDKVPELFKHTGSFLEDYPFFLPCAIAAATSFLGLILGYFFLEETLASKVQAKQDRELGSEEDPLKKDKKKPQLVLKSGLNLLKSRDVLLCSGLYGVLGFWTVVFDEVFSIWSVNEPDEGGGLDFNSVEIGLTFAAGGITLVVTQLFIYPRVCAWFGPLKTHTYALIGCIPLVIAIPCLTYIAHVRWLLYLLLFPTFSLMRGVRTLCFTSVFMLVNHSAPPSQLGAANGIAQSAASFTRAVGPAAGAALFAWSVNNGVSLFALDHFLIFEVMILFIGFGLVFAYALPKSINERKEDIVVTEEGHENGITLATEEGGESA